MRCCPQLNINICTLDVYYHVVYIPYLCKMDGHVHGDGVSCGCSAVSHSVLTQTMSEMEFERGLWQAAMDGSVERVRQLLQSGIHPDVTDSSSYTSLV